MRTNLSGAVAAVIVALEGIGVGALAIREIIAMIAGDTAAIDSAIALLVLTVVGAIALIAFAVAIWRGQSWGRSGGIVAQLLILAVALGAVTGAYAQVGVGIALAVPALIALILLVLAVRHAGRSRAAADGSDSAAR